MRRPSLLLILAASLGLILGACSGAVGSPGESAGGESQAAEQSTPAAQSQAPAQSQAAAESQAAGGGGTGEGGAPALADGAWTGGQGQVTVSGAVSWSTDEPITTDVSDTTDAKTLLAYNSDDTFVTIFINLTGVPFNASVTAPEWDASSSDCEVTYNTATDTEIDATFSCVADEFYYFGAGEDPTGEIVLEGSFTATR
jgi:hypothetical protein